MNTGRRIIDYGKRITSTRWLFVLALWVPFLFTLNVAFLALQAHRSDDRDSHWVLHTAEVKGQLEQVNSLVKDVESSVRVYLLTGDSHFLTLFGDARKEIPAQSQEIALLVADNPRQVTRADHLRTLIANELLADSQLVALAQQEKKSDAIHIAETGQVRAEAEIQAQVEVMATEEDRLFAIRENALLSEETIQNRLMIGLVLMDSALIVGATLFIWRLEKLRQKARAQAAQATAHVEQAQAHEDEAIRASELRYRRLFETARDGILILDTDTGQVVDANPFIKELLGYSQEEILGRKLWEICPSNDVAAAKLTFAKLQNVDFIRNASLPLETKDGRRIEVEFVSSTYKAGQNRLIQSNIRDIMERKSAEQQRMLLETCVSNLSDIIVLTEAEPMEEGGGKIIFANKAFERMTGYTFAETIGQNPRFLQGEKTDRRVVAEIHEAIVNQQPIRRQIVNYRKDGSEFWLDIDIVPVFDAAGKCTNFAAVERDITGQKNSQESLDLFRALMERSLDGIEVVDPDTGRFLDFNATACERLGYSRQEMLSLRFTDVISTEESPASVRATVEEMRKTGFKVIESRQRRKDGSSFPVEISVQYIELNRSYMFAVVRDITDRKRNEARFRRLVDSNVQGVFFWNKKGEITGANDAFLGLLRYTREDLEAGRIGWSAITPPEFAYLDRRGLEETASTGISTPYEKEFIRKDGSRVAIYIGAATFEDNPDEGVAFALDLTERKRAAGQIAEQAALLDEARDGILVRDLEGTVLSWNKGAERIYGWTREEVIGGNVCDFHFSDQNEFNQLNKLLLDKGEWQGELRNITKDGRMVTIEGHWTLIRDDEGHPKSVLVISSDITEKKNIEAQFMRSQRMESIGTLAGGIAHDLNNILAPIMMAIEILKSTATDPQAKSILGTIEVSARRGADIVRQVLSFARGLEGSRVEIQPRHLLMEIETIIKNTFPKNIRLRFSIPNDLSAILGDPTQVHQILLNLCVNARDAMPDGGALNFSVEDCLLDENHTAVAMKAKAGRYVHICISDSGTGIPREIIERIFEPFFTTKDIEKGTGLGLSTVMAIIKSHDGNISVTSEPGKGTTFDVYLPSIEMSSKARTEQDDEMSMPTGNGETVLVVDDEAAILTIATQTLQAFGYSVLTASDGAEALAIYAQHRHKIDVVLTDMSMPVMDGAATINALSRINPAVKIVAASGLGSIAGTAKGAAPRVKHFLSKPFTAATLLKAIRATLDES